MAGYPSEWISGAAKGLPLTGLHVAFYRLGAPLGPLQIRALASKEQPVLLAIKG